MMFTRILILIGFSLAIDLLNMLGFRQLLRRLKGSASYTYFFRLYWLVSAMLLLYFSVHFMVTGYPGMDYEKYRSFFFLFGLYMLVYMPRLIFVVFVIWQFLYYQLKKVFKPSAAYIVKRNQRPSFLIQKLGLVLSVVGFMLVLYGMIWGKSDFVVREKSVYFTDLPQGFDGFRIAQISDMHLGSFVNTRDVKKGLKLLADQKADIILFTGDMVNNVAAELDNYIVDFAQLNAPYGLYSILGNHDMGDYVKWKAESMKFEHIQQLITKEKSMGFKMLLNENNLLYRGGDSIALLGVENWGKPPFKQYGNLSRALKGVESVPFKVLMSHDPSHFNMEVKNNTSIQLTLAGHTHGMQIGFNIWGWQWSPIKWLYPQWMGLYQYGNQALYVNPGFGYIGMPARIGIRPEITILTLRKSQ